MPDENGGPGPEDLRSTETQQPPSRPPEKIGNYRILQKVGEGGMGEVYEAEQEKPVRRKVALKIIKWGMALPTGAQATLQKSFQYTKPGNYIRPTSRR